ncbi:MAG: LysM peptidoglycan-binding domain-containing protein [Litorilinea sp.]
MSHFRSSPPQSNLRPRRLSRTAHIALRTTMGVVWALCLVVLLGGLPGAPMANSPGRVHAQTEPGTYTVVPGDSLSALADRFGVTLEELQRVNGIADPNLLEVGQILILPGAGAPPPSQASTLPTVRAVPGDTLGRIAGRLDVELATLAALNGLDEAARLFPGQPIYLPADRAAQVAENTILRFGAVLQANVPAALRQGRTGRIRVDTRRPIELRATWNGLPISFTPNGTNPLRQTALIPAPALIAPASYQLVVAYTAANGRELSYTWPIAVVDGGYDSQVINLPPDRGALLEPEIVADETAKVVAVWSHTSPHLLWNAPFLRPVAAEYPTTSPFGTRRAYNAGPFSDYHAGQDFGVPTGIPVLVPGDAIVAMAAPLTVRGNAVILDHGRGIYSGYWHLNEINVEEGMLVQAGDVLGTVGNTGLSTGAHLHWELRIHGIAVDPMQFLEEGFLQPAP